MQECLRHAFECNINKELYPCFRPWVAKATGEKVIKIVKWEMEGVSPVKNRPWVVY